MIFALGHNLFAIMAVMLLLWGLSVAIRDVSFIDAIWAYGMAFLVTLTAFWLMVAPNGLMGVMILVLVLAWGMRLGTHLLLRWRRLGPDPRYEKIIRRAQEKKGWSFATTSLLQVFLLQGPLVWMVSLPAQAGLLADDGSAPGVLAYAGAALAVIGITFESIGDAQLDSFRADPANKGKVLDTGLWRYTRHPNYFGDACTWWGIWMVSIAAGAPWWTTLGPLFLTFTLTRWSGAPMLEHGLRKSRPEYAAYVERTSGFIPMPPKS